MREFKFRKTKEKFRGIVNLLKILAFVVIEIAIIIVFMSLELPSYMSILFSNVITFVLALYSSSIFKSFNDNTIENVTTNKRLTDLQVHNEILEKKILSLQGENKELQGENKELQGKNKELQGKNKALQEQQDFERQNVERQFRGINFNNSALVLGTCSNYGYIVKDDSLYNLSYINSFRDKNNKSFSNLVNDVGGPGGKERFLLGNSPKKKILFARKLYHENAIGIKLCDIKIAKDFNNKKTIFSGINIHALFNRIITNEFHEYQNQCKSTDKEHCFVYTIDNDGNYNDFKTGNKYRDLTDAYSRYVEEKIIEKYNKNINEICRSITKTLKDNLIKKYKDLEFIDDVNKRTDLEWITLNNIKDINDMKILIDLNQSLNLLVETKEFTDLRLSYRTELNNQNLITP